MRSRRPRSRFSALSDRENEQTRERAMVVVDQADREKAKAMSDQSKMQRSQALAIDEAKRQQREMGGPTKMQRDDGLRGRLLQDVARRAGGRQRPVRFTEIGTRTNTNPGNPRQGKAFTEIRVSGGGRHGMLHQYANGESAFVPRPDRHIFKPVRDRAGNTGGSGGAYNPPEQAQAHRRQEAMQRLMQRRRGRSTRRLAA